MKLIISLRYKNINQDNIRDLLKQNIGDFEYIFIRPQDRSYRIDEIKTFISKLCMMKNYANKEIFYVITDGDNLNHICQNALLKSLEESKHSIGIIVSNPYNLLPTVISRCQIIYLDSPKGTLESDKDICFDDIPKLLGIDRRDIIEFIEQKMLSTENYTNVLHYHEAINRLSANCKIEAVLFDLVYKLSQNPNN